MKIIDTLKVSKQSTLNTKEDSCFVKTELVNLNVNLVSQETCYGDDEESESKDANASHSKDPEDNLIPKTFRITSKFIDRGSGQQKQLHKLEKAKKAPNLRQEVLSFEAMKSDYPMFSAKTPDEVEEFEILHESQKQDRRDFYYSNSRCRGQPRYEFQRRRFINKLCVGERNHVSKKNPVLFVGDRGYGINSQINGHLRCGGTWKAKIHAQYCPVLTTNEHNTSQTCVFCFSKTSHPLKIVSRKNKQYLHSVNGTPICMNPDCVLRSRGETHKGRNSLSSLAIGLAGLSAVAIGQSIPCFDPTISKSKADNYKSPAKAFLNRNTTGSVSSLKV
ncbi:hypothetical protein MAM1_0216c08177 [Mucor ambiguus]|uniref:Uncharacterized protein n=1 Tax=Mucor ambiguus TaxID=91626 RepID=A0A0C9MYD0_9FUNG|nr:hypothetical protein MAM1_0216c08177 [Mucor ambiguus]